MPKKPRSKRRQKSSFLTPDFLRKQRISLEAKLTNCRELQRVACEGIKVTSPDERRGDELERALTCNERRIAAQQLEVCGKTISKVIRALDSISFSLGEKKSGETYGICLDCGRLIPQRRLEAIPWADRCVPCQEEKDVPVLS